MKSHGYSDRFIHEIIAAATRVSYGQFEDINVFAGKVQLLLAKLVLYKIYNINSTCNYLKIQATSFLEADVLNDLKLYI